jgi:hypothetical protein
MSSGPNISPANGSSKNPRRGGRLSELCIMAKLSRSNFLAVHFFGSS